MRKIPTIFVYPTESFYALGADATDPKAIRQLFRVKHREKNKPIALIAADFAQVKQFFVLSKAEERLARRHWPGPLTMVLTPKAKIAARALGARRIGVRVPKHAGARVLAKRVGAPVTATSANISGQAPTKSKNAVQWAFPGILVIAGKCGNARLPSTVITIINQQVSILRPGAIHAQSFHS